MFKFFVEDQLNIEAKHNDETKNQLSTEIKQLREKLDEKMVETTKSTSLSDEKLNAAKEIDYEKVISHFMPILVFSIYV